VSAIAPSPLFWIKRANSGLYEAGRKRDWWSVQVHSHVWQCQLIPPSAAAELLTTTVGISWDPQFGQIRNTSRSVIRRPPTWRLVAVPVTVSRVSASISRVRSWGRQILPLCGETATRRGDGETVQSTIHCHSRGIAGSPRHQVHPSRSVWGLPSTHNGDNVELPRAHSFADLRLVVKCLHCAVKPPLRVAVEAQNRQWQLLPLFRERVNFSAGTVIFAQRSLFCK
jgi:hypothetical protein